MLKALFDALILSNPTAALLFVLLLLAMGAIWRLSTHLKAEQAKVQALALVTDANVEKVRAQYEEKLTKKDNEIASWSERFYQSAQTSTETMNSLAGGLKRSNQRMRAIFNGVSALCADKGMPPYQHRMDDAGDSDN